MPAENRLDSLRVPLQYLSAVEALAAFRSGELTPVRLFEAVAGAVAAREPSVNALTATYFEQAVPLLERAGDTYARHPDQARPLDGLLLAVKELSAVRGQQHTLGSRALRHLVATETEPAIQRAADSGAVVHARTNTPEFGCASFTDSPLFGQTRNPWNTAFSPAGSSGGSAAALAAGMTTLATGTDSAGSLRLPASACGVVGFKPSHGRVPQLPPMNLETCNHLGPMARTVADCALLYDVMSGPHRVDLGSYLPDDASSAGDDLRVGVVRIEGLDLDDDVADTLRTSAEVLRDRGFSVTEVDLGWHYDEIIAATKLVFAMAYAPRVRQVAATDPDVSDYALDFVADVLPLAGSPDFVLKARETLAPLQAALADAFTRTDVLVLATLPVPAPQLDDHYLGHGPVVGGVEQPDRWLVGHTVPFNLMSSCPVLDVPAGLARTGVPIGVQLVGRPYADRAVLDFGRRFEAARALGLYETSVPDLDAEPMPATP